VSATAPSQTVFSIGYDFHVGNGDNGNVFGITNYKDQNRNQTFTYDALNRLISAQNAGTDCTVKVLQNKTEYWGNSYGYDAWGNLLQKSITKCGAEHLSVTADAHNWLHSTAPDYQYDAAGNMTYDATASLSYTFDQENRLTGAAGYTYTYDADGNRVRKSNGNLAANGTLYWYMTPGVVAESDLGGSLKSEYVFFDGERVARRDGATGAGGVFYYFSDHLKTASVITDSAGVIKAESDYYPWGGELQFVNNDSNDYKFTGKKRDFETGLDYFGARYYSNALGRFMTPDWAAKATAVPYAEFSDPQSLNLYTYVRNIPTTRFDADGHIPQLGKEFLQTLTRAADEIANNPRQAWRDAKQSTVSFVQSVVNLLPVGDNKPTNPKYQSPRQDPPSTSAVGRLTTAGLAAGTAALPGPKGAGAVVEDANLGVRAAEIHGALDPIAQSMRTTAVANVTNADGTVSTLVSSSNNTLAPVQRAVLKPGETAVSGAGHAEETILNAAQKNGQTVNTMGVSRTPCPSCAQKLKDANVDVQGPR
jgi:RHS repeat-associated protein